MSDRRYEAEGAREPDSKTSVSKPVERESLLGLLPRPERSFWQLMPKKTMFKGIWLLLMLAGIIWFQSQSMSCATTYTEKVVPAAVPAHPPYESQIGRTVRMAPMLLPDAGDKSP